MITRVCFIALTLEGSLAAFETQQMLMHVLSLVHVGEGNSQEFEVKVQVHQGSVLSPLLFIITQVPLWSAPSGI